MTLIPFAGSDKVDLKGKFEELLGLVEGGDLGAFFKVAAWIGAIVLVMSVVAYVWQRRRGTGGGGKGGSKGVTMSAIVGGILVAPGALLPLLLGIIDTIINAFINIGGTVFGS